MLQVAILNNLLELGSDYRTVQRFISSGGGGGGGMYLESVCRGLDLVLDSVSDLFTVDIFRPGQGQEGPVEFVLRQVLELDLSLNISGLEEETSKEKESQEEGEEEEVTGSQLDDTQTAALIFL